MEETIFINGRFLTQPVTGVQRYSLELMRAMDLLLQQNIFSQKMKLICLAPPEDFKHPAWENIAVRKVGLNKGNLWEQIDLPLYARGQLLFSPANSGPWHYRNQAVTLHDASIFAIPDSYSKAFRAKYNFIFKQLSQRARLIFTDSNFSRRELARYLNLPPQRFTVIPLGCDHLDRIQADAQILDQYNLKKDSYLLTVTNQSVHKNLGSLFKALKLANATITIVAVGEGGKHIFKKKEMPSFAPNVQMLGCIDDQQLKALYENALGFIFPSIYEGFGLPVLEAMRCGCPVLCSNAAALPEIATEAACYFDPYRVDHIAGTLNRFISDPQLHEELRGKGYRRSAQFRWSTTAKEVLENLMHISELQSASKLLNRGGQTIKRLLDLVLILAASPLLLLLLVTISVAIKLDSRGSVFYAQKRIGRLGREIHIWKFRSMAVDAEEILQVFLSQSPALKGEWEDSHKLKNDPRITRFGNLLRRTSLDELPQIWNVLRGEMSLIGPRPIVEEEIPLYGKELEIYKQVLPGLTGMWQISGRNDLPYHERVRLDTYYIQNWSIWLDIYILMRTLPAIVGGNGAY